MHITMHRKNDTIQIIRAVFVGSYCMSVANT